MVLFSYSLMTGHHGDTTTKNREDLAILLTLEKLNNC